MSQLKKIIIWVIAAVIIIPLVVWRYQVLNPTAPSDKPVVKIGMIFPMTGDMASFGEAAKVALAMFQDKIAREDTHYHYRFIIEDNQLQPMKTAIAAKKLIVMDKVDFVITFISVAGEVAAAIAEEYQTPHFTASPPPVAAGKKYTFGMTGSEERMMEMLYQALKKRGFRNIEIVAANTRVAEERVDIFKKIAAADSDFKINAVHRINPNERDFRMMIAKIRHKKPDMIVAILFSPQIEILLKQLKETGGKIPVAATESFNMMNDKTLAEGFWGVDAPIVRDQEWLAEYQSRTGRETTDAAEYTASMLAVIHNAYQHLPPQEGKKPSADQVIEAVMTQTDGLYIPFGKAKITADGVVLNDPVLRQIVNGQFVILEE